MGKISLYVLLILTYLGLAKSLKTDEKRFYLKNELSFTHSPLFLQAPISVILIDSFSVGLILKTYLHKYRIIRVFAETEDILVKTSYSYWKQNKNNIGMSLYRKDQGGPKPEFTPLPPGSYFIGRYTFGSWRLLNSGTRTWKFHRSYRDLPNLLGWGKWRPTKDINKKIKIHNDQNLPYYGPNHEFGTDGSITKIGFSRKKETKMIKSEDFLNHLKTIFKFPAPSGDKDE